MTDGIGGTDGAGKMQVQTRYVLPINDALERTIFAAAGRPSDYSGAGFGERDHGWYCDSQLEAHRIGMALKKLGLHVRYRK